MLLYYTVGAKILFCFLFSWASLVYLLGFCEFLSLRSHQSSELQLLMIAILSYQYSNIQLFKFKACMHEEVIRNLSSCIQKSGFCNPSVFLEPDEKEPGKQM